MLALLLAAAANLVMATSLSPSVSKSWNHHDERDLYDKIVVFSLLDTVPKTTWDAAATSLLEKGVATVRFATNVDEDLLALQDIHSIAFRSARNVLDRTLYPYREREGCDSNNESMCCMLPMIPSDADSAHVTGFHHAGGMSRYNVKREGIVFSDEGCSLSGCVCGNHECYKKKLSSMFCSLHGIANKVLLAIERKLELRQSSLSESGQPCEIEGGWFQHHLGPTETSSQWHVKRFVDIFDGEDGDSKDCIDIAPSTTMLTETGERITLPMHTDPSLISVVIHDSSDKYSTKKINNVKGALGLEYYHPKEKRWIEPEAHGHGIATIFVGSVLAHLTSGQFPAAKHRVVERVIQQQKRQERMAATLFVRPQPSALLQVPLPSPWLLEQLEEKEHETQNRQPKPKKSSPKPPITFDAWLKRVAKNYEKQKKKQKNKTKA